MNKKLEILPSDEELENEFNVDPTEFKKHVKALSRSASKLAEMGFHIFGGDSAGRLVSNKKIGVIVAHLNGDYEGGVGDDLVCFESNN
jgi:hypothetical protein